MLCKNPYPGGTGLYGCGQCLPCRINRSRLWMNRQLLESFSHDQNMFVTLTYDDQNLPDHNSLVPAHLRLWLKRLRKAVSPRTFKFYGVGEYGQSGTRGINPHYHVSLFGLSGNTTEHGRGNRRFYSHTLDAEVVQATWKKGQTFSAEFNAKTALYTCGYIVKRLTSHSDPRLQGRHPEFARMSNRPGLGAELVKELCKSAAGTHLVAAIEANGDVPDHTQLGRKPIQFGRYLLNRFRKEAGLTDTYIQTLRQTKGAEIALELLSVFQDRLVREEALSLKETHLQTVCQAIANAEAHFKIWQKQKGHL